MHRHPAAILHQCTAAPVSPPPWRHAGCMSLGYAEKLSYREDLGGQLGAPELFDSPKEVEAKAEQLAELVGGRQQRTRLQPGLPISCIRCTWMQVRKARRIVVFTGAGISTACGIPDFRGPGGIWTLQRAGTSHDARLRCCSWQTSSQCCSRLCQPVQ